MNIFKGLQAASLVSLVALGVSFAAACTDDPGTPGAEDAGPDATPAVDGGGTDAADANVDPCALGEPNDTIGTATTIQLNTTYNACVSGPDMSDNSDFYVFTAPATDLAGGYVQLQMEGVAASGLAEMIVTDAEGGVIFDSSTTTAGESVYGWLTVAPGAKYTIEVTRTGGAGDRFAYNINAKYTAIVDTFEPNNTTADAKPIVVGTPITASAAAPSAKAQLQPGEDSDFYKVTLAGGDATVTMSNVPADYLCEVIVLDSAGASVNENDSTTPGATCTLALTGLAAGSYFVQVAPFSGTVRADKVKDVPASVTGSYTLNVTQP